MVVKDRKVEVDHLSKEQEARNVVHLVIEVISSKAAQYLQCVSRLSVVGYHHYL